MKTNKFMKFIAYAIVLLGPPIILAAFLVLGLNEEDMIFMVLPLWVVYLLVLTLLRTVKW